MRRISAVCMEAPLAAASLFALALIGPCAAAADPPPWSISTGWRFAITRDKDSPWPATVGWVRVWPQDDAPVHAALVTSDAGGVVGTRVLWSAPGAPLDVLFDTSAGAASYRVYLADHPIDGAPPWDAQAGVVLETRRFVEMPIDAWKQFDEMWAKAAPILGRSLVGNIFDGIHRHGPTYYFCGHYRGYFSIATAGEHAFATLSDDGSFVFIDGRQVAEWPGYHGLEGGMHGQHQGNLALASGRHVVDYYHFQGSGGCNAELAWKPPGADRFEVMPATAFLPVARFTAQHAETAAGVDALAFSWEIIGHTTIGGEAGGPAMVDAHLRLLDPEGGRKPTWSFDDGTAAEGTEVRHLFPQSGVRVVRVEANQGGKPGRRTHAIAVHPQWLQAEDFPEHRWQAQRKELLARDASVTPSADLAATIAYADALHDHELLMHLAPIALKRAKEFTGASAEALLRLGLDAQHQDVRQYQTARELLAACVADSQAPAEVVARARLHLGGLLVHGFFDHAAALDLLQAAVVDKLSGDDQRLLTMYVGDALLASGAVEPARQRYLAAGTAAAAGDLKYALARRTRLETARDYIAQGEYDAAEGAVRAIEWETPVERLGTETGLLLVAIWSARKELPFALSRCKLMLISAPDDARRPEVLLALVHLHLASGHKDQAAAVAKQLLNDHPYSEAAARAKDLSLAQGGKL